MYYAMAEYHIDNEDSKDGQAELDKPKDFPHDKCKQCEDIVYN